MGGTGRPCSPDRGRTSCADRHQGPIRAAVRHLLDHPFADDEGLLHHRRVDNRRRDRGRGAAGAGAVDRPGVAVAMMRPNGPELVCEMAAICGGRRRRRARRPRLPRFEIDHGWADTSPALLVTEDGIERSG